MMAKVRFTSALKRFFPSLAEMEISGATVREALFELEKIHPGILSYLTEENGQLRKHVNVFVRGELIEDRINMKDSLGRDDELFIFQALSGG